MGMQTNKNYDPRLVGAATDQGPTRQSNQDAFWAPDRTSPTELGALYIVADGVGGQEHGAEAARMVTAVLSDVFYRTRQHGKAVAAALEEAVQQANQAVFDDAGRREARMGATVVAAVVADGTVTVAHAGDARAYLLGEGQLRPLTRDDTWVQNQVDAGLITPESAEKHEFRNVVTQALGNRADVDVHITPPQPFGPHAALLLCSDGLYDPVSPEEMYAIVVEQTAPAAARALVEAAITAQATDNITAVVVKRSLPGETAVAPAGGRRAVPFWLPLVIIVMVLAMAVGLFSVWRAAPPRGGAEATLPPSGLAPVVAPGAVVTATAVISATSLPTATALPAATATVAITATATVTPEPSVTPTSSPPLACVVTTGQLFVWPDAAMEEGGCETAVSDHALLNGEQVLLPGAGAQSLPVPRDCSQVHDFIFVQSVNDPAISGWVFAEEIRPLEPGESCP